VKRQRDYITHDGKEYIAVYEVLDILGLSSNAVNYSKTFDEIVKINNIAYISKEEFEKRKVFQETYIPIADALKLEDAKRYKINNDHLSRFKSVTRLEPESIKSKRYIEKKELEQLVQERKLFEEEYINVDNIHEILGFPLTGTQYKKFKTYNLVGHYAYVKKVEVLELKKFKEDTILLKELKEFIEDNGIKDISYKMVNRTIERLGIKVIKGNEHQLSYTFIYKKDIKKILKCLADNSDLKEAFNNGNGFDVYRIKVRDMPVRIETKKTMDIFNRYVKERMDKRKTNHGNVTMATILYGTYQILSKVFFTEFEKYSREQIDEIVEVVSESVGRYREYPERSKYEFVCFINYLIRYLNLKDREEYIVDRNDFENISEEGIVAYTQKQFLQLFGLLHKGIWYKPFLDKAIQERSISQAWLYMYLHFVSLWRSSDYQEKLVTPNLKLLKLSEVYDGESFLSWLYNQKHVLADEKDGFTEAMGIAITEDVKHKMHAILPKISKTNENLYIEVGQFMSPVLGLLLAICEAHRQIDENRVHKTHRSDILISFSSTTKRIIGKIFDGKVIDILGDNFKNTRANKSYNDYIHDYSEDNGKLFAAQMISIMRGYKDTISETTSIYETRWIDRRYDAALERLWDLGTFCGFKRKFIEIAGQGKIVIAEPETQDEMIKQLSLSPYQCELIVKSVYNQRKITMDLITRLSLEPNKIQELMWHLAFNNTNAKHNHTKCLFKAFLLTFADDNQDIGKISFYEYVKIYRNETNCLHPDYDTCFGCPMLICEMYFLHELNSVFWDAISSLKSCDNEYEQYIYTNLILSTYYPILIEAQSVLGKEKVNSFIDTTIINDELEKLEVLGKMQLEFSGGQNDSGTSIG
jgi:hypothetical protein